MICFGKILVSGPFSVKQMLQKGIFNFAEKLCLILFPAGVSVGWYACASFDDELVARDYCHFC